MHTSSKLNPAGDFVNVVTAINHFPRSPWTFRRKRVLAAMTLQVPLVGEGAAGWSVQINLQF